MGFYNSIPWNNDAFSFVELIKWLSPELDKKNNKVKVNEAKITHKSQEESQNSKITKEATDTICMFILLFPFIFIERKKKLTS